MNLTQWQIKSFCFLLDGLFCWCRPCRGIRITLRLFQLLVVCFKRLKPALWTTMWFVHTMSLRSLSPLSPCKCLCPYQVCHKAIDSRKWPLTRRWRWTSSTCYYYVLIAVPALQHLSMFVYLGPLVCWQRKAITCQAHRTSKWRPRERLNVFHSPLSVIDYSWE